MNEYFNERFNKSSHIIIHMEMIGYILKSYGTGLKLILEDLPKQ